MCFFASNTHFSAARRRFWVLEVVSCHKYPPFHKTLGILPAIPHPIPAASNNNLLTLLSAASKLLLTLLPAAIEVKKRLIPEALFLHLMSYNEILIIQLIIRAVPETVCQEFCHLIFVQIHLTAIAFIIVIIHIVDAGITIRLLRWF